MTSWSLPLRSVAFAFRRPLGCGDVLDGFGDNDIPPRKVPLLELLDGERLVLGFMRAYGALRDSVILISCIDGGKTVDRPIEQAGRTSGTMTLLNRLRKAGICAGRARRVVRRASPQIPVTLLTNARILNFEGGRQRRVQASDTRVVSAAMSSFFCRTVSLTRPRAMQCCQRLQIMLPMPGKGRHSGKWTCSFNRVILFHVRVFKHLHSVQQGDQCHAGRRN
jgi:hypothetical protein